MRLGQVAAVVDSDTCTGERVRHAVAYLLDTDELVIVEKFCGMVDVDGALYSISISLRTSLTPSRRSLLCLSLWLTSQIEL